MDIITSKLRTLNTQHKKSEKTSRARILMRAKQWKKSQEPALKTQNAFAKN